MLCSIDGFVQLELLGTRFGTEHLWNKYKYHLVSLRQRRTELQIEIHGGF